MPLTADQITELLALDSAPPVVLVKVPDNFLPCAVFLLGLNFSNLFEATTGSDGWWFRCKGCTEVVKRSEREEHYKSHKDEIGERVIQNGSSIETGIQGELE